MCLVLASALMATADPVTWEGDISVNWANVGNWDLEVLPGDGDDAIIDNGQIARVQSNVSAAPGSVDNVLISGASTVEVVNNGTLSAELDVIAGSASGSLGTLSQTGGTLNVGSRLIVGDQGEGAFTKSGGTTTIGATGGIAAMFVGNGNAGSLTVSGGTLTQADVDADNDDSINQIGFAGGSATVELSAGTISMFASTILGGESGQATVNQGGGTFAVRDRSLLLGGDGTAEAPSSAQYNMSGGTLSTGTRLAVGFSPHSSAEMNISGGAEVLVGGPMLIGVGGAAQPQDGDTDGDGDVDLNDLNDVRNFFGEEGPDDGSLAGDAFPFDGVVDLGDLNGVRNFFGSESEISGPATGVVNQTGGDVTIGVEADPEAGEALILGLAPSGNGVYNLSGGTLTTGATGAGIGIFGTGTFNLSGTAEFTANSDLIIGNGVFNQSGGIASVVDTTPAGTPVPERTGNASTGNGVGSVGEMNISGGTMVVDSFNSIGELGSLDGSVNVSGDGTLATGLALQVGGQSITGDVNDPLYGAPTAGRLVQTGGAVVTEQLQIAAGAAATGVYEFQDGVLEVNDLTFVGPNSFEFEPGVITKGDGTYVQTGGDAAFHHVLVLGDDGKAVFSVDGGTAVVDVPVPPPGFFIPAADLGFSANGDAELNVSGGDLSLEERIFTSQAGRSVINQSGGNLTVTVTREPGFITPTLMMGNGPTGDSEANISGGAATFNDVLFVGFGGSARWNQSDGVVTVDQLVDPTTIVPAVVLGNEEGLDAEMNFIGGEFTTTTGFLIGHLTQTHGIVNVSDTAHLNVGEELIVGAFVDGDSVNGVVNQSGGTVDVGLALLVGLTRDGADVATGAYNMSGGTLSLPANTAAVNFVVGDSGDGVFHQTGGVVNAPGSLGLGGVAGGSGTYILEGGTLELSQQGLLIGDGTPNFEFTGGRLSGAALIDLPLTQTGGVLSTGVVPGATEITGDYNITVDGTLEVKLGGYSPIDEHDFFQVDGVASLGGTLHVELVNDFEPLVGDAFEVLTSAGGAIVGCFDDVTIEANPGNLVATVTCETDRVLVEIIEGGGGIGSSAPDTVLSDVAHTVIDNTYLRAAWDGYSVRPVLRHRNLERLVGDMAVSGAPQAVPEPATWALGLVGILGGIFAVARGRSR